jgi:CheY-like chemotaxis protein
MVACLWPLRSVRSRQRPTAHSLGGLFHAGQRTLLDHLERYLAFELRHPVPHRPLTVPGPWEVLVIEDDELDRELVAELLTLRGRGGVRMTEARDLHSGLAALDSRRFDLVMLDTKLPETTALHALRAVGDKAPLTPILPHPAYISAQARQLARQRGAFDVVVRGDLNAMWAAVNKLLTLSTFGSDIRSSARAVGQ